MRLIDADALRKEHCEGCSADIQQACKNDPVCASLMWVDEAPTIDAVPVVRCEDCKWFIPAENLPDEYDNPIGADGLCDNIDKYADCDGFCSCGERRAESDV